MKITSIYICPWSLRDPLCQSQSLAYLKKLAAEGDRFALITFEQSRYALNPPEEQTVQRELAQQGIFWYPLRYRRGSSLFNKALDGFTGILTGIQIILRHRPRIVHSRSALPCFVALVLAYVFRLKFLYDADEILSEEYVDAGYWQPNSLARRVTSRVENLARRASDATIVLTERLRMELFLDTKNTPPVVIPCCIDLERFAFDPQVRDAKRQELKIQDDLLFVYVGKTGSCYQVDQMFEFYRIAREQLGCCRLLILSPEERARFDTIACQHGVASASYEVKSVPPLEVVQWLCAADMAFAFVKTVKSKRASSLIKVGEYLAVGVPVVITEGIGDYSDLIARRRLGVVMRNHSTQVYVEGIERLKSLLSEGDTLRQRCRATASEYVCLDRIGRARYREVYQGLLCQRGTRDRKNDGLRLGHQESA